MKKLLVVLAVAVSGVLNAQSGIPQSDLNKFGSDLQKMIDTMSTLKHTNDDDQSLLFRLPYTLFTDSLTKYEYAKRSPNIVKLSIEIAPMTSQIKFNDWLKTIHVYNSAKYDIQYFTREMHADSFQSQLIFISNLETGVVRRVIFRYFENDLISIVDSLENID
jgi:hypothetical protein